MKVSELRFTRASEELRRSGLLGWTRFDLGPVAIDGVAVRKTVDGRHVLAFPERRGHAIVRPITDAARREIEEQILGSLRASGVLT